MDGSAYIAVASVIVSVIGAGAAELSRRAAAKASAKNTETTSRTDLEKEAFERAKEYYGDAMNRQDNEISRQDHEIVELHTEVNELKAKVRTLEREREDDRHTISVQAEQIRSLSAALAARGEGH